MAFRAARHLRLQPIVAMKLEAHATPEAVIRLTVKLAQAEHRIRTLRRAALMGGDYSPREFDQAVLDARQLRAALCHADGDLQAGTQERRAA